MRMRVPAVASAALMLVACEHGPMAPDNPTAGVQTPMVGEVVAESRLVLDSWPSAENPGPPFYARIEPASPHLYVVNGLAVIAFYRDPGCIRADFNLLSFFDAPAAFGCPLAVEGFSLWRGAPLAGVPWASEARGLGSVTFWFVPADVALAAVQDGMLTIGELESLPGRMVGHAAQFSETLHPGTPPGGAGGHRETMFSLSARGRLEDGRVFEYHVTTVHHELVAIGLRIG